MNTKEKVHVRIDTVLDILEGRVSKQDAAVEQGLSVEEMEQWTTLYLAALRNAAVSQKRFSMMYDSKNRKRTALIAAALVVLAVGGAVAAAADLNCPGSGLICFNPNTPAKASEVNHNFAKMGEWVQNAVGPMNALIVDSATTPGMTTIDADLSVSGNIAVSGQVQSGSLSTEDIAATGSVVTGPLIAQAISIGTSDVNKSLGQYIGDYVRANCYIQFGWRDSCDNCTTYPLKYGKIFANGTSCEVTGAASTCDVEGETWLGINTDGTVDENDKFYIRFRCD